MRALCSFVLSLAVGSFVHTCAVAQDRGAVAIDMKSADGQIKLTKLYSKSYALVIGIDAYTQKGWRPLRNAVRDATLMKEALEQHGFEVTLLSNLKAAELYAALQDFFINKGAEPDGRLFIWFAGHGHTLTSPQEEGYLVASDTPSADVHQNFKAKALPMSQFGVWMTQAVSKHVLAVFDSCFSGLVLDISRDAELTAPPDITSRTAQPARQMISSGDRDQSVSDNGTFRKIFIDAIMGKVPNLGARGYVTGRELGVYLRREMTFLTSNTGTPQSPNDGYLNRQGYRNGDFVFRVPRVEPAAVPAAKAIPRTPERPASAMTPPPTAPVTASPVPAPSLPKAAVGAPKPTDCNDPLWPAEDTKAAFEQYLRTPGGIACSAAASLAYRDLDAWSRIEPRLAARNPSSAAAEKPGPKKATVKSKAPPEPAVSEDAALVHALKAYLNTFGVKKARRHQAATAALKEIEAQVRHVTCDGFAKEAMKRVAENEKEQCGLQGAEWDALEALQYRACQDAGPEAAAASLAARDMQIAGCKLRKTDATDWLKVEALLKAVTASGGGTAQTRALQAATAELKKYLEKYQDQGQQSAKARQELAAAERALLVQACDKYASDVQSLVLKNQDDPNCKDQAAVWSPASTKHADVCLTLPEAERKERSQRAQTEFQACSAPRRDSAQWSSAQSPKTLVKVARYLSDWGEEARHKVEAMQALNQLCAPLWQTAKNGGNWKQLSAFIDGNCDLTSNKAEAERLRKALDERLWREAKAGNGRADYVKYLEATDGSSSTGSRQWAPIATFGEATSGGSHSEEASSIIADFDAWAEANNADASCETVAGYLQNNEKGRFRDSARRKLTSMIEKTPDDYACAYYTELIDPKDKARIEAAAAKRRAHLEAPDPTTGVSEETTTAKFPRRNRRDPSISLDKPVPPSR